MAEMPLHALLHQISFCKPVTRSHAARVPALYNYGAEVSSNPPPDNTKVPGEDARDHAKNAQSLRELQTQSIPIPHAPFGNRRNIANCLCKCGSWAIIAEITDEIIITSGPEMKLMDHTVEHKFARTQ